jgi:1-phosphofructokinase/tagatose 6-phosphate kinase
VGSGDAFLAGFISARFQRLELADCLRHALAGAAANTQRYGAGVLDADDTRRLYDTTDVVELEDSEEPAG